MNAGYFVLIKIKDYRALYGALALALIGFVLSLQSFLYVNIDLYGTDIITARWHWEVVLNIQILCFAFMWFSHHNRILFAKGRWKARAILNFLIGFAAVGMPITLTILGAWMDWYRTPPGPEVSKIMIQVAVYIWLFSNIVVPALQSVALRKDVRDEPKVPKFGPARHTPGVLMLALLLLNDYLPLNLGYVAAPFLCFLHGALVYAEKAMRLPPYEREDAAI